MAKPKHIYAALEGLTDHEFSQYISEIEFGDEVFLYKPGEVFLSIWSRGTKTIVNATKIDPPKKAKIILIPVSYDHSFSMKNLRNCEDHFALLMISLKDWTALYVDGKMLVNQPFYKDPRYRRVRTNLLPKLRKIFNRHIPMKTFRFKNQMR